MAMQPFPPDSDTVTGQLGGPQPASPLSVYELLPGVGDGDSLETVLTLFRQAITALGADAGVFVSRLRDDATRDSLRSLWASSPEWAAEYATRSLFLHDPWLRYATHESEPVFATDIAPLSPEEAAFLPLAAGYGFASAVIAPAPSSVGQSRVGVLCLGSSHAGHFESQGIGRVRVITRALAMELNRWLQKATREELLRKSKLTASDIELLRHEAAGHTSKIIAAALQVEAKTIDCRFQRLNAKLNAPDRRTALRIARLYGVL